LKIIFFHSLLFTYVIYLHGFIFLKKIFKLKEIKNFYEISLIGLIITIVFAQFLNFFIPLNDDLLIINIILLIIYTFFSHKILIKNFRVNFKILILLGITSIISIYGSGFSDDINHYHYSYIANSDVSNFIWGNSFLHPLYGTASSWLIGHSYFNFDQFRLQDIHILNGIIFFLVLGCFFSELNIKNKKKFYHPILFAVVLFVLLKYTRLKEFGIDRPSTLIFCFLIYFYCKYFIDFNKKNIAQNFIIVSLLSIFIFSIKIIYLPILFFPLIIFFRNKLILLKKNSYYLIILLPIFVFFTKNILGSGCLIYPVSSTCIEFISWSNSIGAKELSISAEVFNKSWYSYTGDLSKESYIQNFNWFLTWFERGKIEIFEFFLTIILVVIITFILFDLNLKKNNLVNKYLKDLKIILLSIIIFSTTVYFLKNPVIRMNHFTGISLMILMIFLTFRFNINKHKIKFVSILLFIGLLFNLSKNLQRIYDNNFVNNPYKMISEKVEKQKKKNLNDFTYYIGWYGEAPISSGEIKDRKFKKILIFNVLY